MATEDRTRPCADAQPLTPEQVRELEHTFTSASIPWMALAEIFEAASDENPLVSAADLIRACLSESEHRFSKQLKKLCAEGVADHV